jgi:hypothetical protein
MNCFFVSKFELLRCTNSCRSNKQKKSSAFEQKSTKLVRARVMEVSLCTKWIKLKEIEKGGCLLCDLLHAVQSAAGLEPGDLQVVEAVVELDLFGLAVGVFDFGGKLLAWGEAVEAEDGDLVGWLDLEAGEIHQFRHSTTKTRSTHLVVISSIGEGQRQNSLLLQVRLVDASE